MTMHRLTLILLTAALSIPGAGATELANSIPAAKTTAQIFAPDILFLPEIPHFVVPPAYFVASAQNALAQADIDYFNCHDWVLGRDRNFSFLKLTTTTERVAFAFDIQEERMIECQGTSDCQKMPKLVIWADKWWSARSHWYRTLTDSGKKTWIFECLLDSCELIYRISPDYPSSLQSLRARISERAWNYAVQRCEFVRQAHIQDQNNILSTFAQ